MKIKSIRVGIYNKHLWVKNHPNPTYVATKIFVDERGVRAGKEIRIGRKDYKKAKTIVENWIKKHRDLEVNYDLGFCL